MFLLIPKIQGLSLHANCRDVKTCILGGKLKRKKYFKMLPDENLPSIPASILRKSTSGRHRAVSYPDGQMTARYRFTKNADWDVKYKPSFDWTAGM